ncbi:shikimate dehydrogenase [Colwelliaceae bacterium 6471]
MDQYCVYGNPIEQSRSPFIHQMFAQDTDQPISYTREYVELGEFAKTVNHFIANGGKGANVTVPFKEEAMALCHQLSNRAKLAGAVNTLSFIDGQIIGDNTDGIGLVADLLRNNVPISDSKILLLGAGGAAKGVILPLLEQAPDSITIANRTVSKAKQLCVQFNNNILSYCSFESLGEQSFDLIINATSASLSGSIPPISAKAISKDTICYDMVYGAELTPFLCWAKQNGAKQVFDGLGMLVAQAAESFFIWRGVKPEVTEVLAAVRASIHLEVSDT